MTQAESAKPPALQVMTHRALFLDFDGVLHPTCEDGNTTELAIRTDLFVWLPALEAALEAHRDVAIVISSTWRYTHDVDELRQLLGGLGPRVVGATPRGPRFESILWWLHMNKRFASYRVLDDDPKEFPSPAPPELILCDPKSGVAAAAVLAALGRWLENKESR